MSTNPNKAIGTNAAYGGRTSVKAFNDALGVYDGRGVVSGWGVSPKLGMVVKVGGNGTVRDIAIAENNTGDYTTINNISEEPVSITIPTAPTSNARYDSIVAYVDNPPSGSATVADNPAAVGIIVVSGTVAGSPTFADESTIRDAITVDGGTGATAYYVVLADIYVASGTTDITTNLITVRNYATTSKITPSSVTSSMLAQEGLGVPMYASNLAIANDTPRVWAETLGGTGHYWIWYEESGLFANQPTQWGVLEVFVWVDGAGRYDVSQTWYNHPNGTRMYHRTGNSSGWNGSSSGSGAFTQLAMLPVTSDNIDWTTQGWEKFPLTLVPDKGYVVSEDHSAINRRLGLMRVHYEVRVPDGVSNSIAYGVPNPATGESMYLPCRCSGGTLDGKTINCWVRGSSGAIGIQSVAAGETNIIQVMGIYPIKPSNS